MIRKYFTEYVDKIYHEKVDALRKLLNQAEHAALTSDLWTDPSNLAFITMTCHTIIDFKLYDLVLCTRLMGQAAHTGPNLSAILSVILFVLL